MAAHVLSVTDIVEIASEMTLLCRMLRLRTICLLSGASALARSPGRLRSRNCDTSKQTLYAWEERRALRSRM